MIMWKVGYNLTILKAFLFRQETITRCVTRARTSAKVGPSIAPDAGIANAPKKVFVRNKRNMKN